MQPQTSSENLLYVSSPKTNDVYVYSYPGGSLVGTLTGFENILGACSDSEGDVWITNSYSPSTGNGYLLEYAHGGTSPVATLQDSSSPRDCSWDPTTGNLAVADYYGNIALYPHASGSPTYISTPGISNINYIGYDGFGNAYFDGYKRDKNKSWIPAGSSTSMNFKAQKWPSGCIGWDGTYVTAFSGKAILQYRFNNGRAGKPAGTVKLNGVDAAGCFTFATSSVVVTQEAAGKVELFHYPQGGNPTVTISGVSDPFGIAYSAAASAARRKR